MAHFTLSANQVAQAQCWQCLPGLGKVDLDESLSSKTVLTNSPGSEPRQAPTYWNYKQFLKVIHIVAGHIQECGPAVPGDVPREKQGFGGGLASGSWRCHSDWGLLQQGAPQLAQYMYLKHSFFYLSPHSMRAIWDVTLASVEVRLAGVRNPADADSDFWPTARSESFLNPPLDSPLFRAKAHWSGQRQSESVICWTWNLSIFYQGML